MGLLAGMVLGSMEGVWAQCAGGESFLEVEVVTDAWGYEAYWEIVPSGGIGAYSKGNGLDLGGTFEFHLGIGASYAVTGDSRLGLAIYHISNAGTHRKNPGVNTVAVTWSFAFDGP